VFVSPPALCAWSQAEHASWIDHDAFVSLGQTGWDLIGFRPADLKIRAMSMAINNDSDCGVQDEIAGGSGSSFNKANISIERQKPRD
jgi:hypothetical protein